ncbi:hypothetical protein L593_15170 [Salinarchaeum sp. Harcht-Bsk1]|uniref:DUF7523 family protein n=1 Tax=Salinarchaeum sp. Harcht-Bsk1 TaxID=1333523 RepID=UPI000342459F|nr:hypothetical protein [Salinarchaeum sp. Harcht-Bsk1]AGN02968.1 hypothetical protein L593_15170 [Salinarchaeum sp. Harcht-Bsk1]
MSVAERTREAVRADPALYDALRAGVVNYSAAARSLAVDGDVESIATALRRYAEELPTGEQSDRRVSVRLHRGVALDEDAFGGVDLEADGDATAIQVTGDVDARAFERVLGSLRTAGVAVTAGGFNDDALVVGVEPRTGPEALRVVERALESR